MFPGSLTSAMRSPNLEHFKFIFVRSVKMGLRLRVNPKLRKFSMEFHEFEVFIFIAAYLQSIGSLFITTLGSGTTECNSQMLEI